MWSLSLRACKLQLTKNITGIHFNPYPHHSRRLDSTATRDHQGSRLCVVKAFHNAPTSVRTPVGHTQDITTHHTYHIDPLREKGYRQIMPNFNLFFFNWLALLYSFFSVRLFGEFLVPPGLIRFARCMSTDKRAPGGFTTEPLLPSPCFCVLVALHLSFYFPST